MVSLPQGGVRLAADHAACVRSLARTSSLLRRRCLVAVPADPGVSWVDARHQLATRCADRLRRHARALAPRTGAGAGG